jgi:hypothetical protein
MARNSHARAFQRPGPGGEHDLHGATGQPGSAKVDPDLESFLDRANAKVRHTIAQYSNSYNILSYEA